MPSEASPYEAAGLASYIRSILSTSPQDSPHSLLLRHVERNWSKGLDLMEERRYHDIVELWQPVRGNPFLDPTHPEWRDKSAFRAMVRSVVMQLFVAHANRAGKGDLDDQIRAAYGYARMLAHEQFLLETAPNDLTLDVEQALVQDQNLNDILDVAVKWSRQWLPIVESNEDAVAVFTSQLAERKSALTKLIAEYEAI
jgi:hypothetical protein